MTICQAKCKVCGKELKLQIADGYDVEHDPNKLLPYATCNSCFDLMVERRKVCDLIAKFCRMVSVLNPPGALTKKEVPMELRESVARAAKMFSAWCAKLLRRQHMANSGQLSDNLIKRPTEWWTILIEFEDEANQS